MKYNMTKEDDISKKAAKFDLIDLLIFSLNLKFIFFQNISVGS